MVKQMNNSKLVSVVVPVFNIEPYVSICIDSICRQTYRNIEIILVDDGSSDNSGNICDNYAETDSRIRVIHKQNGGLVSARKAGYETASGEYCINVDGDDWVDESMVERLFSSIERNDADFVQCGYIEEKENTISHRFQEYEIELADSKSRESILTSWMREEKVLGSQIFTKIYKLSFLKKCYSKVPNEMNLGEDMIFFLHSLGNAGKIASISDVLYHYRIREKSLSHAIGIENILKEDILTEKLYAIIKDSFSNEIRQELDRWVIARKLFIIRRRMNIYIPKYQFMNPELLFSKKIVVYGAGSVGYDCVLQLSQYEDITIKAWVDKNYEKFDYSQRRVRDVSDIAKCEFDYIIIAVLKKNLADEIMEELQQKYNIQNDRMLWNIEPVKY